MTCVVVLLVGARECKNRYKVASEIACKPALGGYTIGTGSADSEKPRKVPNG